MSRQRLSNAKRVRIFLAADGACHICGMQIRGGEAWDVEHKKPLWLGGADDESNMRPAHKRCHKGKSADEAGSRAKSDRVRAFHLGIKKAKRTIPGRKFDGTPIPARWRVG